MKTYLALSALLSYPEPVLIESLPEVFGALEEEAMLTRAARREVAALVAELATGDPYDLQERYVSLFDRSRALSLHLFEHVHGESRDRGQAMVDLLAAYARRGVRVVDSELPDYLPAFLEFLSLAPRDEAKGLLAETADILRGVGDRLAARGSRYSAVFAALLAIAGEPGLTKKLAEESPGAEDLSLLDREWKDPEVNFGGPQGGPQPVEFYPKRTPA
jgi:nitrate reductase molybdenum cofactor assembly chaperone NarJ/NarW